MSSTPPRQFRPLILAGASARDRLTACLGAAAGIGLTAVSCMLLARLHPGLPMLVAPMGASAVLLYAVPTSPLAQPWPIIGGNSLSALVGIIVAHLVHTPWLAAGLAVGLAIGLMSVTRSLNPPGGASALLAVLGGSAVTDLGYLYAFAPVALNSVAMVVLGWAFHKLMRHPYPHVAAPPQTAAVLRSSLQMRDVDAALADMGEPFDIHKDDLLELVRRVQAQALMRMNSR